MDCTNTEKQTIALTRPVRAEIEAHAIQEYPYECCGFISGQDDPASWTAHRCRNIQNELHAREPERYPRDARTAYTISPQDLQRIFEFDHPTDRIVGLYHSHPDHEAYFSDMDRREAKGLVEWLPPEIVYLVVSVIDGTVRDIKAFSWDEQTQDFQEQRVEAE